MSSSGTCSNCLLQFSMEPERSSKKYMSKAFCFLRALNEISFSVFGLSFKLISWGWMKTLLCVFPLCPMLVFLMMSGESPGTGYHVLQEEERCRQPTARPEFASSLSRHQPHLGPAEERQAVQLRCFSPCGVRQAWLLTSTTSNTQTLATSRHATEPFMTSA